MKQNEIITKARENVENSKARSAWARGVKVYAGELLDNIAEALEYRAIPDAELRKAEVIKALALNGAESWRDYSLGGCSLIYDGDIAGRLCSPSELKRTRDGEREPNARESWLDVQARALSQAYWRVVDAFRALNI